MLEPFRITNPLETGPHVRVYSTQDPNVPDIRRVFVQLDREARKESNRQDLEQLLRVRKGLDHPSLVKVLDFAHRGRHVGLIAEFISSPRQKPPWQSGGFDYRAIKKAIQLAYLVAFLHKRSFLLGYLTPRQLYSNHKDELVVNVLLSERRYQSRHSHEDWIRYTAPEFLFERCVSQESDLFSLGMLFYWLFTSRHPYAETKFEYVREKQRVADPIPPRKLNPDIPQEIDELIQSMIRKDPSARPQGIVEVIGGLKRYCGEAVENIPKLRGRFVARERELSELRQQVTNLSTGKASQFTVISGPSGVGKSTLISQLQTVVTLLGIDFLKINHHPTATADSVFARTVGLKASNLKEFTENCFQKLKDMKARPIVLLVNDLQWIDEGASEFYRRLFTTELTSHVLVVGEYRPERESRSWATLRDTLVHLGVLTEFRLAGLGSVQLAHLLRSILGATAPRHLVDQLFLISRGNPLHIHELLRFARDNRELSFCNGSWEWDTPEQELQLPLSVAESVCRRLARLDSSASRIVEVLAVLEVSAKIDLIAQMVELEVTEVEDCLPRLEGDQFVSVGGSLKSVVLGVGHDWIGRVVRDNLGKKSQEEIRTKIINVLEARYLETQDPSTRRGLVFHVLRSNKPSKATQYLPDTLRWQQESGFVRDAAHLATLAWRKHAIPHDDQELLRQVANVLYTAGSLEACKELCKQTLRDNVLLSKVERVYFHRVLGRLYSLKGRFEVAKYHFTKCQLLLDENDEDFILGIESDLLVCHCRLGEFSDAQSMANRFLSKLSSCNPEQAARLYHSLCNFYHQIGDVPQSLEWGIKAIQLELERSNPVRAAGRASNLGFFKVEIGHLEEGEAWSEWSLGTSKSIENCEVELFARATLCLLERKKGHHESVSRKIRGLLKTNRTRNRNLHVEAELLIELAKNCNYLLLPDLGLSYLGQCKSVLKQSPVHPSITDAAIARGWTWLLLGKPDRALKAIDSLEPRKIPRERGRYYLLLAAVQTRLDHLDSAWKACLKAYQAIPKDMPYYRCRARLAQARIQLARHKPKGARKYISEALDLAKEHFYLPLLAEGYLLSARWFLHIGDARKARLFCLRAGQVCAHCDRPAVRAEILKIQGRSEARLHRKQNALDCFTEAVRILKERMVHVSSSHRDSFAEQFIAPLEAEREALSGDRTIQTPRYFIQLRHLADRVSESTGSAEIGQHVVEVIESCLQAVAANIWLAEPDGSMLLVARLGRCQKTGEHLLSRQPDGSYRFDSDALETSRESGFPLRAGARLIGLIYIEWQSSNIRESAIDFLDFLARFVSDKITLHAQRVDPPVQVRSKFNVDAGRVLVGGHPSMARLYEDIRRIAPTQSTALIYGESGTGKELVARAIHSFSQRRAGRFVAINCAALPGDLIESELFGHSKGSFTGATRDKVGLFESASGGTLFLDEVASMPLPLQSRLLRVLQERRVRRIGESRERPVNVRMIAATNQQLESLVHSREFRQDLYHRLNVVQLRIPPLRERRTDIPELVAHFLERLNEEVVEPKRLSSQALDQLAQYEFPGNVRELENIIESAFYLSDGTVIQATDLARRLGAPTPVGSRGEVARDVVNELTSGRADFWQAVRDPFLRRDLTRQQVKDVVAAGLKARNGNYREVVRYFNLPDSDYKKFLGFLNNHDCGVDFRPFRKSRR